MSFKKFLFIWLRLFCSLVLFESVKTENTVSYRLDKSVIPEHYTLHILTFLEDDLYEFDGNVLIKMVCKKRTDKITLHLVDLYVDEGNVTVTQYIGENRKNRIGIVSHLYNKDFELYTINLKTPLKENTNYELYIPFKGNLTEGLAGFYRSSYKDMKTGETKWLAVTQFEATDARRAFPCFDEPEMKANFSIRIGHSINYTAISNMPIKRNEKLDDGWVLDFFEDTVKMSTYLVAFLVSDFDYKFGVQTNNKIQFKIWAREDALNQVDFAGTVGPKYLEYYEDFFDINYPLPKQDMVAIPDFNAGAMENWGLITYRETALLYDPKISSLTSKERIASVVAHELAHQWFGNLVTMKWWTDLWLNEGFATYMASKAVHAVNPEWNSFDEESLDTMLSVYALDSLQTSHPISIPIGDPKEIAQIFDTISYRKGSFCIRMMNLFLGENVFRLGVSNYLKKFSYKNAEQDDLWKELTEEARRQAVLDKSITVKQIMDTWTLQTGFPVVTVIRDYKNNIATLTQNRFLKSYSGKKDNLSACWWIPLSYTTESELDFTNTKPKKWFECDSHGNKVTTTVELPGIEEWVIFNIKSSGLYKVNYDIQNWELLINALIDDKKNIPVINRVQLLDDSMDLAASGHLDYSIALKLFTYLTLEDDYLAWDIALDKLSFLNTMLKRRPAYGQFKKYITKILTPIYEKVAYETTGNSSEAVKRQILISHWACRFEVGDCQEQSIQFFNQWMQVKDPDQFNPIPKDLHGIIYCTALRNGGVKEWDFLWQRYLKSNVGTEKNTILSNLGCTNEIWLLNRYLDWSVNSTSGIRKQDMVQVFSSVARNNIGFFIAKDFFRDRILDINEYLGTKSERFSRYLKTLSRFMITEFELEEMKYFTNQRASILTGASLAVKQSLEKIAVNINWQQKYYDKITKLLEDYSL